MGDENLKGNPNELNTQQQAIAFGMLFGHESAVTDYKIEGNLRVHKNAFQDGDFQRLVRRFQRDPKDCLAYGRQNLFAINRDPQSRDSRDKKDRLNRYLDAYLDLTIKLDKAAFPADPSKIHNGIPDYVPDGLSDMGSDSDLDPRLRSREKIRVNKKEIFKECRPLLEDIFSQDLSKKQIVEKVAAFVNQHIKYDFKDEAVRNPMHSVPLAEYGEKHLGVCRHYALYTQVLLQACGITSRVLKCDVEFPNGGGAHACNLVRIDNQWYLLDTTGPSKHKMAAIPEKKIDLNKDRYEWNFRQNDGRIYKYKSRNNMYYRIMDNSKPL